MVKIWAISGVDLHLDLDGTRVRAALESALRDAVSTGRLRAGIRLPSSRALAADLGIARNTVTEAYGQLVAEGWLTAMQGSGTRVAERVDAPEPATPAHDSGARRARYDLGPGSPDVSAFPRAAWIAATRRALSAASFRALDYGDPRGRPELRAALADYVARARGVRATPERVIVCSGFTQGFRLLCEALRAQGARTLAIERYIQPATTRAAVACGLKLAPVDVDDEGAAVERLGSADVALLTPAHQFPIGTPLAARRRALVAEWSHASGGLIIEDDYDGEFRYDRHPLGALQALAPQRVVYAGTASKTLAPGIRLGWLVVPAHLVDGVLAAKAIADRNTSAVDQLALAELIGSGAYDRHIRRSRLVYRRRRDRLVAALQRHVPAVRISGVAAGLHALLELPAGVDEDDVVARAGERGLSLQGLGEYAHGAHTHPPALVVGYAKPPEHAYTAAVARLVAVLREATS
ncbi:MAG TPA: PLP-dependent aminotransferase family protein [Solirubrobacteraceae bacterium]|nr:PLP-dependent aminotransferase family protein [Solirubrobacteraceae bacterium]